jgi:hypothetical protein
MTTDDRHSDYIWNFVLHEVHELNRAVFAVLTLNWGLVHDLNTIALSIMN